MFFKVADSAGLNRRFTSVLLLSVLLAALAAMAPAGGIYRDTQAALFVGAAVLFMIVLASGVRIKRTPAHLALAGFCVIAFLTAITSVWRVAGLLEAGLIVGYLIIFTTATNVFNTGRLRLASHALVGAVTVVALSALYAYTIGYDRQIKEMAMNGNEGLARQLTSMIDRAFGNFPSANSFAGLLALIIPLAIGLWLYEHSPKLKVLVGIEIAVLGTAVYLSRSKGGWLALVVGISVLVYGKKVTNKAVNRLKMIAVPSMLLAGAVAVFWVFFKFDISAAAANVSGRVELWRGVLRMLPEKPWVGIGAGNFGTEFTHYQTGAVYSRYVHNTYLQVAVEQGILGSAVFLLTVGAILVLAWRCVKVGSDKDFVWIRLGLLGGITTFIVHNAVDYTWYIPGVSVLFWVMAGLAVAPEVDQPKAAEQPTSLRWALVALAALVMVPALLVHAGQNLVLQADSHAEKLEFDEAKQAYALSLRYFPYNAEAYNGLARTVYVEAVVKKRPKTAAAADYQRKAVKLRPTWPYYRLSLAGYLAFSERRSEAVGEYRRAIELYPNNPRFKVALGNYLLTLKRYSESLNTFQGAAVLGKVYRVEAWTPARLASARGDIRDPVVAVGQAYVGMAKVYVAQSKLNNAVHFLGKAEQVLGHGVEIDKLRSLIKRRQTNERQSGRRSVI